MCFPMLPKLSVVGYLLSVCLPVCVFVRVHIFRTVHVQTSRQFLCVLPTAVD